MERQRQEPRLLPRLALHAAAAGLHEEAAALYIDLAESRPRAATPTWRRRPPTRRALELLPSRRRTRAPHRAPGPRADALPGGPLRGLAGGLARARQMARRLGNTREEVEMLLDEATAFDWSNDYARSEECVTRGHGPGRARALLDSRLLQVRLMLGMGRARWRQGQWEARPAPC